MRPLASLILLLLASACSAPAPVPLAAVPAVPGVTAAAAAPALALPPSPAVAAEADRLRAALAAEVPGEAGCRPGGVSWIAAVRHALAGAAITIDRAQLVVAVDRNPAVQALCLLLARPDGDWQALGGGRVSTGQAGRKGYYITPTGVFAHTEAIIDYRALGTVNENGIRGLGAKGMRVWDFGWQWAQKGWRADREPGEIRLLLHATDPDLLEPRLGRPASQGCVRVSAAMNRFLDHHGVLDHRYEAAAAGDARIRSVLALDRQPTPLAGDLLVIVDSADGTTEPAGAPPPPPLAGSGPPCD